MAGRFWIRPVTSSNRYAATMMNTDASGLALEGHDPVAYFEEGRPVVGDPRWQHRWNGADWHFTSPEHRDAFAEDPLRYAPQFGGYCAVGRATGVYVDGKPTLWRIDDGRLYLNKNRPARAVHGLLRRRIVTLADRYRQARLAQAPSRDRR